MTDEEFLRSWGLLPGKVPDAVMASTEPIIRFFAYHDAHPVALSMVLIEKFGHQWVIWEPETLKSEILATFNATSISDHNWGKIQALRTLMSTVSFWHEWPIFEKAIQALNNNIPKFDIMQRCTLAQLMAGVDVAKKIRQEEFGTEVRRYVAACAVDQGVMYLPEPLSFASAELLEPKYVCLDCGNVDDDDLEDGRCDFCVGRFQDERPLNGKPMAGIPDSAGRNIRRFVVRNPKPVQKAFDAIKDMETYEIDDESPEEVQAGKLVIAHKYKNMRLFQLVKQLEELKSWVSK